MRKRRFKNPTPPTTKLKINGVGNQGGDKYLKFLRDKDWKESNFAVLKGDVLPTSCGYVDNDEWKGMYVSVPGGPTIQEHHNVPNNPEYIVRKIHYSYDSEQYVLELDKLSNDLCSNNTDIT